MPSFKFSEGDLLKSKQLDRTWYPLQVIDVTDKPGKKDPNSTTWTVDLVVIDGPGKGVEIRHYLSTNMLENCVKYVMGFTGGKVDTGKDYDPKDTIGKEVAGYCAYDDGEFKGNKVLDFMPIDKFRARQNGV